MNITAANMDALFRTFQTKFTEAQKAAQTRQTPNDLITEDIAISFIGSGSATQHSWLNQLKGIHEWVNQRTINALDIGKLTVVNRDFENTVTVSRNEIEDDQYGVYAPLIGMMGADAEGLWKKLAMEALVGNGDWADGNKFFCSGRKWKADGTYTFTNATTTAFSKAAVEAAIAAMRGWKLAGGESAEVRPDVLLVGPALEGAAKQACEADLVSDGTTTVSNVSTAKALKVRVSPAITGAQWYVLGDKNGVKAVGIQKRKLPQLTRLDNDTDQEVFMSNNFLYGVHARGEGFLTLPFLAYAGGMASVPEWTAE